MTDADRMQGNPGEGQPDMGTPASTVTTADRAPTQAGSEVQQGLGTTRYKEYDYPGYAQLVRATVPGAVWSGVFYSWMSLKGHLLGLHDFDRSDFFITALPDGAVDAVFVVVFREAESLAEWIEHGYPVDAMLTGMGVPAEDIRVVLARDFS